MNDREKRTPWIDRALSISVRTLLATLAAMLGAFAAVCTVATMIATRDLARTTEAHAAQLASIPAMQIQTIPVAPGTKGAPPSATHRIVLAVQVSPRGEAAPIPLAWVVRPPKDNAQAESKGETE